MTLSARREPRRKLQTHAQLGASAEAVILAHKRYKCFRGIRNNLHGCCIMEDGFDDPSGEITSAGHAVLVRRPFEDPTFLQGFPLLAKHELLFECACWHNETPQLTALARQFPEQSIVCDHVSTPLGWGPFSSLGASAVFEEWKVNMTELAGCPNVMVKLSGLTMPSTGAFTRARCRCTVKQQNTRCLD